MIRKFVDIAVLSKEYVKKMAILMQAIGLIKQTGKDWPPQRK